MGTFYQDLFYFDQTYLYLIGNIFLSDLDIDSSGNPNSYPISHVCWVDKV